MDCFEQSRLKLSEAGGAELEQQGLTWHPAFWQLTGGEEDNHHFTSVTFDFSF
jgi:hypothetical protein